MSGMGMLDTIPYFELVILDWFGSTSSSERLAEHAELANYESRDG